MYDKRKPLARGSSSRGNRLVFAGQYAEHELGAKLAIEKGSVLSRANPVMITAILFDLFYKAISLFDQARTTKRKKFAGHARKYLRKIKHFEQRGNPNAVHLRHLLEAELLSIQRKFDESEKSFQSALVAASRGGFIHHAALTSERYGEFLLRVLADEREAAFRFQESIRLYADWGATKKRDLLLEKYRSLLLM